MKVLRLLFISAVSAICLSGCLQIEKIVKLKPDGSGTIEETLVMSKETAASLQQMVASLPKAPTKTSGKTTGKKKADKAAPPFQLLDEAKLRAEADKMGEGVKFVSAKKIDTEKTEGYTAVYSFTDINKVKVDQNPGSALPGAEGGKNGPGTSKVEPLVFHMTKGTKEQPAELAINMPQPQVKTPPKEQTGEAQDMAMQMMKQIFKDMKITIAVEIQGKIEETNAEYHDGSRVTLLEMDFNKLLANPDKFKELAQQNPQTLQDSKALLKGIDGVKIESAPEVKVKFE